mmetsp:Transcript_24498/g.74745  ORF Transcript_24498/g.74745 Transcript_24498/m.74745 type:complete len:229 (-) Transcript_24498:924-1610(-)
MARMPQAGSRRSAPCWRASCVLSRTSTRHWCSGTACSQALSASPCRACHRPLSLHPLHALLASRQAPVKRARAVTALRPRSICRALAPSGMRLLRHASRPNASFPRLGRRRTPTRGSATSWQRSVTRAVLPTISQAAGSPTSRRTSMRGFSSHCSRLATRRLAVQLGPLCCCRASRRAHQVIGSPLSRPKRSPSRHSGRALRSTRSASWWAGSSRCRNPWSSPPPPPG